MTENAAGAANWGKASRQWSLVGSPLRPDASDVAFAEAAIAERFRATGRPPRAVLLGVTPELAACRWPASGCSRRRSAGSAFPRKSRARAPRAP